MSMQDQSVIARTNNLINNHKVASSLIAGSMLASTAFVSAAAITLSGQTAMESYSYPITSQYLERNQDKQIEKSQITTTPEATSAADEQSGQVQGASNTVSVSIASPAVVSNLAQPVSLTTTPVAPIAPAQPSQPVQTQPVDEIDETPVDETPIDETPIDEEAPVDETPVDETPTDESPVNPQPSYAIVMFDTIYNYTDWLTGGLISSLGFDVSREPGHNAELTLTALVVLAPTENHNVRCEISTKAGEDHRVGSVRLITNQDSPLGLYECAFEISDGITTYLGVHTALLVDEENLEY